MQDNNKLEEEQDMVEFEAKKDSDTYIKNVDLNKRNSMIPKPPKPGELMYCQICGKVMYPKDFSTDVKIRKYEFKWHIHKSCEEKMFGLADRNTPGLLAERGQKKRIERSRTKR